MKNTQIAQPLSINKTLISWKVRHIKRVLVSLSHII
jgi:hypothetical protein